MRPDSSEILFLKKAARHAWRLGWLLAALQVAATAAGVASFFVLPKRYSSTTTIRVERSQLINPLTRGLAVSSGMEDRLGSIRQEILSPDYFDKVIERLDLERPGTTPLERNQRVEAMIANTAIWTQGGGADTFQITYVGASPGQVRDVTNALSSIFIEESLTNKSDEAGSALEFLEGQLQFYRDRLEEAERALRRYEEQHIDQVPATRAAQVARVEQMRGNLVELQNSIKQAKVQRDLLRQRVAGASGAGGEGLEVPNPVQGRIREKEAQLRRMLLDYSESYPDVVALRAEIAQLQREFDSRPTVPADQAAGAEPSSVQEALAYNQLERLELEIRSMSEREAQLQRELDRTEKKVLGIPEVEQELARLRRDYDVNNDIYNNFLRRLEEARVSRELETSQKGEVFRILQAAALPLTPVRPTRPRSLLLGLGAGLALNLALVFLFAQHDTSFQTAAEVKAFLGLRILAGVPRYSPPGRRRASRIKTAALVVVGLAYAAGSGLFLLWPQVAARFPGVG